MPHHASFDRSTIASGDEAARYLKIFLITIGIFIVQVVGGFLSGSLALWSDSVHVATDGISALISFMVARQVLARVMSHEEETNMRRQWMRVSGVLLIGSLVWLGVEAAERLQEPPVITPGPVVVFALIGMLGNYWQHRLVPCNQTATAHMQRLHIIGDLLSSGVVVLGAVLVAITGMHVIDVAFSCLIIIFIGYTTMKMLWGKDVHDHAH